jgi:tetratricopeptide (TPR) repeat protein
MPTLPPYLELAEAAYRQLPANKLDDLVKGLCRLAESWQAHDPQRAGALWDEALALSCGDPRQLGVIELSDAMSTLAAHTPRPADLQELEARNHALAQDFISDSLTTDLVQAWLRLGQPEQAARCLDDYLQLPEDIEGLGYTRQSSDYAETLARVGRQADAEAVCAALAPERQSTCLRQLARLAMNQGQADTARRLYQQSWERYRDSTIRENGRAESGIAWHREDTAHLVALGEHELLDTALPYIASLFDCYPYDSWMDVAEQLHQAGPPEQARSLYRHFLASSRRMDEPLEQARKYLRLARHCQQDLKQPWRAARLTHAAQQRLDKLKTRDRRFYLYEALIRHHLDLGQQRPAQILCRQARLWLAGKPPEADGCYPGHLEGHLLTLYARASLTPELPETATTLAGISGEPLALALADAWLEAYRNAEPTEREELLANTVEHIAAIADPYWRGEMWIRLAGNN